MEVIIIEGLPVNDELLPATPVLKSILKALLEAPLMQAARVEAGMSIIICGRSAGLEVPIGEAEKVAPETVSCHHQKYDGSLFVDAPSIKESLRTAE